MSVPDDDAPLPSGEELQRRTQAIWGVHHIWCNFYGEQHASVCTMCAGLNNDYPQGKQTPDELLKRHFPNVRKVEDD